MLDLSLLPNILLSHLGNIIEVILLQIVLKVNIIMHHDLKGVVKIPTSNPLKAARERLMISKSELARRAGVSLLTLGRIEAGKPCRLDTKRRVVKVLGFNPWLNKKRTSFPE